MTATIGKYQAFAQLGSGGMADVSLAVARGPSGFNKLVVLKMLRQPLANEPEFRQLFLNEARLSARLSHPNVVQIFEITDGEGGPVLVMEYLDGASLNHVLDRARQDNALPLAMGLRIVSEALSGLHYAHELADYDGSPLNVVHRDVSPHNIHVTFDGQVKVLDFGIARVRGTTSDTNTGVIKGKVRYMAPEQMGGTAVDRRADIYSMGAVLWEVATGHRLWKGCSDIETMNRVMNEGVPRARSANPDVPASVEAIIAKALSQEPDDRYATCLELQGDIDKILEEMSERVHNRDIGKMVEALFADLQRERKLAIENLLSTATSAAPVDGVTVTTPPSVLPVLPSSSGSGSGSGSRAIAVAGMVAPKRGADRARRLRTLAIAVAALTAAAIFGAFWRGKATPSPVRGAPSETALEAGPAREPEAVAPPADRQDDVHHADVRVVVRAFPEEASVFVDDVQLTGKPASHGYPADSVALHRVRVEQSGYEAWTSSIIFDGNVDLVVTLKKTSIHTPPVRQGQTKTATPNVPSAASVPSAIPSSPPKKVPHPLDTSSPWGP